MSVRRTIESYDRIAATYVQRWQDRSVMAHAIGRFSALLGAEATVLDIGCGPGFDCVNLRNQGLRVFGLDLSWGMLCEARRHYPGAYVQADMRFLPLAEGIDGIWCNAALLHLSRSQARQAVAEFCRVLLPGGVLYLAVKEGDGEQERSDAYGEDAPRFFTYWQEDVLDDLIRESGFSVIDGWMDAPGEQKWLCRLVRKPLV